MRKRSFQRLGSALLALVMLISSASGLVLPAKADSWPNDTASAEPTFAGYRVKDIENWSPETDPYAEFLVADVPLQSRNAAFAATQANPVLTTDAQIMNMTGDYGNSFFGSTMYTNEFSEDVMTFWQYTDYFSPWHGAATAYTPESLYDPATSDWRARGFEFGIVNIPNPAYTNAAHKNGVLSIACIYFDPAFRPGQTCADMLTNKEGDVYVVAQKLIEMAEYYGFDGYFLNQEEGSYQEFKPFMAYLTAQGLYTQWYDTNSSFNSSKAAWLKDSTYGQIHNSVFVNYSGFYDIDSQLSYAESIGVDPYAEIFYGVEANQAGFGGGHYSATNLTNLYDENGVPRASYALFCGSDRYHRGLEEINSSGDGENVPTPQKDGYQWMSEERERMFWSGVYEDPTNTGAKSGYARTDVGVNDADSWVGVADFIAERSVISGTTFYTNFNTGHGMQYFVDGSVSKDEEWTNINIQEMMPTWQWWFDSSDDTKLHADFDYGSKLVNKTVTGEVKEMEYTQIGAWNGGSSLAVYGDLSGTDTMHLFKTDLAVNANSKASVTFWKVSSDDAVMKLGLIFADDAENTVLVDLENTAAAGGWTTVTADLSAYADRSIAAICLVFEGTSEDYQINIGSITVSDGTYTPDAPDGFVIDTAFADGQMIVRWDKADYSEVVQYNLYGKMRDGSRVFLGGIYGDILYVKNTFCTDVLELQLCAVGVDGSESEPATLTYDYTDKVSSVTVQEASSSSGLLTHAANVGKIEVSFEAPAAGAPDSYELEVTLHNIGSDDPYNRVYTATAADDATSAVVSVAAREGYEYDLKIYAVRDGVRGEAIAYRGRSHDSYSEPIAAEDVVITGSTVRLVDPDSVDWYRMTASFDGAQVASFKRGASSGNKMTFSLSSLTGLLSVVVEDYSGNFSEPTVLQLENGVPVDPTDLIGAEQFPDPALLSAVRTQVGITLTALTEYEGVLDLSGTAVEDLTGLELLPGLTAIDFTDCTELQEISGLEANTALNELNISGCTALRILDVSGLGLEKLEGEGTFNALTYVDISDNRLDLSEGTPERAFLDTAIDVIRNGVTVEPDPDPDTPAITLGENLVPGSTLVSSSNINNAASFMDGDRNTDTYANDRTGEASITLDLGESKSIGGFSVWTRMNTDAAPRPFGIQSAKLEVSDSADGTFAEVGTVDVVATETAGELICGLLALDTAVSGRYVRITVTEWWDQPNGDNDWPAMYEAEVYEAVAQEPAEVVLGENLLPDATVVSSTNVNNVAYFVDGDTASSTYADDRNSEASVVLDLGESKSIGGFAVWTQMNSDTPARPFGIKSARVEVSDDNSTYAELGAVTIEEGTAASEYISAQLKLEEAVSARYVRVTVTEWWPHPNGGNDWPAMYECEVFEAVAESAQSALSLMSTDAQGVVLYGDQRPVPYAAVLSMTEPIVREVAAETLDMARYAEISATIRGNDYAALGEQLIEGASFLAGDVDLTAKPTEVFTISIADQNRQPIEGSVIDLSFDATWTVLYKNAAGETAATLTVIVGDGGKITTPDVITNDPFILYATTVSGQVASEMPIYAFDGDTSTKWCPGGNAIQAELSIDVGSWYTLTEVTIVHAGHRESGRNTVDFALQVLRDTDPTAEELADTAYLTNDDNWVTVASYTGNTANETHITFDEPVVGRWFRLDVTKGDNSSQWPSTRIYEWSMMGIPADPAEGEEPADKSALDDLIASAEGYTAEAWTEESWNAFQTALENARTVSADPNADQAAVDAALAALEQAITALEEKPVDVTPEIEAALRAAEEAQAAAEAAQEAAEEARRRAEEAQAAAEEAAASAAEDREAAEAAQHEAEEAQAAAEAAEAAAAEAQAAAEAAAEAAAAHDAAAAEAAAEAAANAQEIAELYAEVAAMRAQMAQYLADAQKSAEEAEDHREAAEAAELACAKAYALVVLKQYADPDDYTEVQRAKLEAAIAAGAEAINAAQSVEDVEAALAEALTAIDAIGELPFVDVPADSFYYEAVKWALDNEITTGASATHFNPNGTLSRAETVTFLWRAAGKPAASVANPFVDVSESAFYYEAVLWAYENGITTGLDDTHFGPYASASRAQVVTFLHRAMGKPASAAENPFSDVKDGAWYHEAVLWAVESGVTKGVSRTLFGVNEQCNRAQMVTFLYRAYND